MKRLMLVWVMILCLVPLGGWAEEEASPALYPIRENGLWGYINRAGEVAIEPQWKTALPFSGDAAFVSLSVFTSPFWQIRANGHYDGLIDRQGNYLVEPVPERIVEEYEAAWLIVDLETHAEGFYDKASKYCLLPDPEHSSVNLTRDDGSGPVAIRNRDGMLGFADRTSGEIVIPFRYSGESPDECFRCGYACPADETYELDEYGEVSDWNMTGHLIDSSGNEVVLPDGMTPVSYVKDGYVVYSVTLEAEEDTEEEAEEESIWDTLIYDYRPNQYSVGLARLDGTVIIEADPSIVLMNPPDENGLVCFLKDIHETRMRAGAEVPLVLAGHMDTEGNAIVPPTYEIADTEFPPYGFVNGYAVIEDFLEVSADPYSAPRWVIIDTAGHEIFSRLVYEDRFSFFLENHVQENGLIWYSLAAHGAGQRRYGLLRIKDGQAEYLTDAIYESHVGGVLVLPKNQQEDFAEGLHPVQSNGLWGYIDEQARWVIPPQYDKAASFHDGLALVEKDGRLMYIDHSGAVVWEE